MTTTVTTELHSSHPRHIRRNAVAVCAAAVILMTSAFVAGRLNDDGSPRAAVPQLNASTADLTLLNGAIHVYTAPTGLVGIEDVVRGSLPAPTGLVGIEDVVARIAARPDRTRRHQTSSRIAARPTGLVGIENVVRGIRICPPLPDSSASKTSFAASWPNRGRRRYEPRRGPHCSGSGGRFAF